MCYNLIRTWNLIRIITYDTQNQDCYKFRRDRTSIVPDQIKSYYYYYISYIMQNIKKKYTQNITYKMKHLSPFIPQQIELQKITIHLLIWALFTKNSTYFQFKNSSLIKIKLTYYFS